MPQYGAGMDHQQQRFDQKSLLALIDLLRSFAPVDNSGIEAALSMIPPELFAPERENDVSFLLAHTYSVYSAQAVDELTAEIQADTDFPAVPMPLMGAGSGGGWIQSAIDITIYIATKAGDSGIEIGVGMAIEAGRR